MKSEFFSELQKLFQIKNEFNNSIKYHQIKWLELKDINYVQNQRL